MTKWEKFKKDKGLPTRKKRSRVIYDPITKDWVPRWGHKSAKNIEEAHNWVMDDKPSLGGVDPFTAAK